MPSYHIGVDVGGTSTDAVLFQRDKILAHVKAPTSANLIEGLQGAIRGLLQKSNIGARDVKAVMLGTTHFVNALVQQRNLAKVYVVRLCGPASRALPPFVDMPGKLIQALGGCYSLVSGGFEVDGQQEIEPLDEAELRDVAKDIQAKKCQSVVICGLFASVNASQELKTKQILEEELARLGVSGPIFFTLSHQVGQVGLLERENAAILNGTLQPLAHRLVPAYQAALKQLGIDCSLFLTTNSATLLPAHMVEKTPVSTFQSGPVNSVRGAAFLTGLKDALVLDIGGTTTDAGALVNGMARPASRTITVCGVRTNLRMPDVMSVALGGGSVVGDRGHVGPSSVAQELLNRAMIFGGNTLTGTDVGILLGHMTLQKEWGATSFDTASMANVGTQAQEIMQRNGLTTTQLEQAWEFIQGKLAEVVDSVKLDRSDASVIVVGGGAGLCGGKLKGASQVIIPDFASVANAVGAAVPQIGGVSEGMYNTSHASAREDAIQSLTKRAIELAHESGAKVGSCEVVSVEEVPLAYMTGGTTRVRVEVVGSLDFDAIYEKTTMQPLNVQGEGVGTEREVTAPPTQAVQSEGVSAQPERLVEATLQFSTTEDEAAPDLVPEIESLSLETPHFDADGRWELRPSDASAIAVGAAVLGTGGGGSTHQGKLRLLSEIKRGNKVIVVDPDSLSDDIMVADCGIMGAPTVSYEKLNSTETDILFEALSSHLLAHQLQLNTGTHYPGLSAVIAAEIGGGNCLEGLVVGARTGKPVVDADFMGRAFPELQMVTPSIYGLPLTPSAIADVKGNVVIMTRARNDHHVERVLRSVCTELGGSVAFGTAYQVGELRNIWIKRSVTLAWKIGAAILRARAEKTDPVAAAAAAYQNGQVAFVGKVVDVKRETSGGFARGHVLLQGSPTVKEYAGRQLKIAIQNENLIAQEVLPDGQLKVMASVPDLICCLETELGQAVATEELTYGIHVSVLLLPAPPLLTTPEALEVVGPAAFGYSDVTYVPCGEYCPPAML